MQMPWSIMLQTVLTASDTLMKAELHTFGKIWELFVLFFTALEMLMVLEISPKLKKLLL